MNMQNWMLSRAEQQKRSRMLQAEWNLASGAELDVEKQADFVAEKALDTDAEGVAGEQTTWKWLLECKTCRRI